MTLPTIDTRVLIPGNITPGSHGTSAVLVGLWVSFPLDSRKSSMDSERLCLAHATQDYCTRPSPPKTAKLKLGTQQDRETEPTPPKS